MGIDVDRRRYRMTSVHDGARTTRALRTAISSLAVTGVGATLALTAVAAPATAAPAAAHQHAVAHHHAAKHSRKLTITGLAKRHHGRTITVFAKTEKLGQTTRHNKKVTITFAPGVKGRIHVRHGNRIHLVASGNGNLKHFVVRHNDDETTAAAPATLIFGTISQENGSLLLVSESDRDNGDRHDGGDNDGDRGGDNDGTTRDDSPGGPGNDGHQIVVDTSSAKTVELDGSEGAPVVGDEVAVLGEVSDNTVLADAIYGFSNPQSFLRGNIEAINGTTVAINAHGHGGNDNDAKDHGNGGNTQLVNLGDVPLFVNGSTGSTIDQLKVGDKLLVIGAFSLTDNSFTPALAFAFNGHDDHPCGDNGDNGGHGGDGPGDGGSDGGSDG
jgi:hypothetical protein